MVVFAQEILTILFPGEYRIGASVLQILSFSIFLYGASCIFTTVLSAANKPQIITIIIAIASIINVILNLVLIKPLGINGAAISTVFSSLIIMIASYFYANKIITIKISLFRLAKILLCVTLAFLIILPIKKLIYNSILSIFICGVLDVIFYITFLLVFKAIREMDVAILSGIMRRINMHKKIENLIINIVSQRTS